eukprot:scaffold4123_cov110-Pinguiococcus_pyrenoidosus.AAC.1
MEGRHRRFGGGRGYRWCGSHDPTRFAATAPSTGTRLPFFLREGMVLNGAPSVQKAICRLTRWGVWHGRAETAGSFAGDARPGDQT